MKLDAVIFDMDGTITDTEKYYNRTWPLAFAACGYSDFTREDALMQRSLNHEDAQKLWESRYGKDFCFETVHKCNTKLVLDLMAREGIEAKPGLDALLTVLQKENIKTAVATASKLDRALDRLKAVHLENAFDIVISASMVKRGKPYPDIYLHVCKELGVDPAHCVALEDSPNGIRSAHDAGCITIMIPDLTPPTPDLTPLLYDWAEDLSKVIPLISRLQES
ncbi:MAG: HAD family hydrolase [Lachnospiraceae bacterium]